MLYLRYSGTPSLSSSSKGKRKMSWRGSLPMLFLDPAARSSTTGTERSRCVWRWQESWLRTWKWGLATTKWGWPKATDQKTFASWRRRLNGSNCRRPRTSWRAWNLVSVVRKTHPTHQWCPLRCRWRQASCPWQLWMPWAKCCDKTVNGVKDGRCGVTIPCVVGVQTAE